MDTGSRPPRWLSIGLALACVFALGDWPYGYYQLLRLAVTAYAGWLAWQAYESNRPTWIWVFGFIVVLYNPFIKVALDRDTWGFVNLVTAGIIAAEFWKARNLVATERKEVQG